MNRSIVFFLGILFSTASFGQEMWGISNSNFSGNMGIALNPATIVMAPYEYDLNFLAGDFFVENSYIYVPQRLNAIARALVGKKNKGKDFFDIYNGTPEFGFAHATLLGPAFIHNTGDEAWAVHLSLRNELSALDAYSPLAKYIYEKYDYLPFVGQHFNGQNFSVAYMSWAELGATYGNVVIRKSESVLKWACTFNLLGGLDGMYLDGRVVDYSLRDSSAATIHRMDATIAHALSANGSTGAGSFLKLRGYGLSTTAGVTYIRHRNRGGYDCNKTADNIKKYNYRIGLSLMDLGFIHFSNEAQMLNLNAVSDIYWGGLDTLKFHSFGHLDTLLSSHINGSVSTIVNKSFSMYLPSAISLQFDYAFTAHMYGNLTWLNRIYFSPKQVMRSNQVDVSVRYEKRRWEFTGDFTFFEYQVPELGIGFRHGIFILGTDRLLELLNTRDLKNFDLFFGFKLNLCEWKKKIKVSCPAYKY
jgi:hypothetical protein